MADLDLGLVDAVVLGLVEGLTEFLPISSTGHLLVAQELLGLGGTPTTDSALDAYAIAIQGGAILAVLVLYRRRLIDVGRGALGRSPTGRTLLQALLLAFAPAALLGLALGDQVKESLFGVGPVAAAWLAGGVFILVACRRGWTVGGSTDLVQLRARPALVIGVAQGMALWPGVSRSLVTILAGLAIGLTVKAAVEFSFLLGLGTLGAASSYELVRSGNEIVESFGFATPLVGMLVAFVAALASIRWMVRWIEGRGLEVFGWYRIAIGTLAAIAVGAS